MDRGPARRPALYHVLPLEMPLFNRDSLVLMAGVGLTAITAVAVVAFVASSTHQGTTSPAKSPGPVRSQNGCSPAGCAQVNTTKNLPPSTVFYGASCQGPRGFWFLNAVEGGGNDQLRPSYALQWLFAPGSLAAKPSGRIAVATTTTTDVTITLNDGTLTIKGTRKPNVHVSASGTLEVRLTGTSSAPTLTFTETGLTQAEGALGLVSPFDAGGQSLVLPITTVQTMTSC
jgi:hypothetical protein